MLMTHLGDVQGAKEISSPAAHGVRFAALDGLRGLAALLVVLYHIGWPNHLTNNNFVANGYVAVDLFFILSGFVIFKTYRNKLNKISELRNFIRLRSFRVYPLHLAVLLVFACIEFVKLSIQSATSASSEQAPFTGENSVEAFVANVVLVQGLHTLGGLSWNLPSWSISCEFATYIVFGIATLTGVVRRPLFFPSVVILATCGYVMLALLSRGLDVTYDWGIVRSVAGFFLGAAVAGVDIRRGIATTRCVSRGAIVATTVAIAVTMAIATGWSIVLVVPLFVVAIAMLQYDEGPVARILMRRSVQYLGRISYSIYMMQFFVVLCVTIALKRLVKVPLALDAGTHKITMIINPWTGDLLVLGTVAALLVVSGLTYFWIECPGRDFGRRLGSGR